MTEEALKALHDTTEFELEIRLANLRALASLLSSDQTMKDMRAAGSVSLGDRLLGEKDAKKYVENPVAP